MTELSAKKTAPGTAADSKTHRTESIETLFTAIQPGGSPAIPLANHSRPPAGESPPMLTIPVAFIAALIGNNKYITPKEATVKLMRKNCDFANRIYRRADEGTIFIPDAGSSETAANTKSFISVIRKTSEFEKFVGAELPTEQAREDLRKVARECGAKYSVETIDGVAAQNFGFVERGKAMEKSTIESINQSLYSDRKIVDTNREYCVEYTFVHLVGESCAPAKYRIRGKPDGITADDGVIEVKNRMYRFFHPYQVPHDVDQVVAYVALGGHAYGTLIQQFDGKLSFSRRIPRAECEQKWASIRRKLETLLAKIYSCLFSERKARAFVAEYLADYSVDTESHTGPSDCPAYDAESPASIFDTVAEGVAKHAPPSIFRDFIRSPV